MSKTAEWVGAPGARRLWGPLGSTIPWAWACPGATRGALGSLRSLAYPGVPCGCLGPLGPVGPLRSPKISWGSQSSKVFWDQIGPLKVSWGSLGRLCGSQGSLGIASIPWDLFGSFGNAWPTARASQSGIIQGKPVWGFWRTAKTFEVFWRTAKTFEVFW